MNNWSKCKNEMLFSISATFAVRVYSVRGRHICKARWVNAFCFGEGFIFINFAPSSFKKHATIYLTKRRTFTQETSLTSFAIFFANYIPRKDSIESSNVKRPFTDKKFLRFLVTKCISTVYKKWPQTVEFLVSRHRFA